MPDDDAYDPTAKGEQVPFTRSMRPPVTADVDPTASGAVLTESALFLSALRHSRSPEWTSRRAYDEVMVNVQGLTVKAVSEARSALDFDLAEDIDSDIRVGEHEIAFITLIEMRPDLVKPDVVDEFEQHLDEFDTMTVTIARKAISNYRKLQNA